MPIVGDVLADRYRIESVLGVGGMACVYRATDLRLDRQVAVKVLVANLAADPQLAERFSREAGAMAGFSHPNIAAVYDVEPGDPETGREPFYVMEYCQGGSLADRLRLGGRMSPAELVPIVTAVSEGLAELHGHGLIHRDVKPANILFARDRPKLADFGVAWSQESRDGDPLTAPGSTPGTLPYLAPELIAGASPSAASDVYALGVTIFLSLTGQYPQAAAVAEPDVDSGPARLQPVSAAAPDLGSGFDASLAAALDADPVARPSPAELAAAVAAGLEIRGVARPNPGIIAAPYPSPGTHSGVDMQAPTLLAQEWPSAAPREDVAAPRPAPLRPAPPPPVQRRATPRGADPRQSVPRRPAPSPSRRSGYGGPAIIAVALVLLVLVAVLALSRLLGGDAGLPVTSTAPTVIASATASPTATASATASPPATASPTTTPLPSDNATILAALDRVDAAIEAARGGKKGLSGRDASELTQLAASVRAAVDRGDPGAAATAAQTLLDRADALTKGLDGPRRDALRAAIADLLATLSSP